LQVAAYFACRGLPLNDFLNLPLIEKLFYRAAMEEEIKIESKKLELLFKFLGGKNI